MIRFLRTLKANKWTSFVTIFGFAAGLAAALLLLIFIQHELSYDRHWHNASHVFRLHTSILQNGNPVEYPISLRKAYTHVPEIVGGIEAATQLYRTFNPEITLTNKRFRNLRFFYADSTFFRVFRLNAVAGDLESALRTPDAIVVNRRTAEELFGEANPIGHVVTVSEFSLPNGTQPVHIAAVVPDLPRTSHLDFDVLLPMSAIKGLERLNGLEFYTYYALRKNVPVEVTRAGIEQTYSRLGQEWAKILGLSSPPLAKLVPLHDIYLHPQMRTELGPIGDPKAIQIFAALTALILLIAIANFVNLRLVHGSRRSLETGIRKTFGATRALLVRHFLKESFLMSGTSFALALYVVSMLVEPFGSLVRRPLSMTALLQPEFLAGMVLLFLITALLAGAYPAWFLSRQQPIQALKGIGTAGKQKQGLRKGIVLAQFAICMVLMTNLLVLQKQVDFMNSTPLGFDARNVVAYQNLSPQLQNTFSLIKNDLLQYPDIESVTGSHSRPGQGASGQSAKAFGKPDESKILIREVRVQPDYLKTYGMRLQAGRSFEADRPADRHAVVLNETAVHALSLSEPVGSRIVMFGDPMEVIGVVHDYHYASLRDPIQPEVFTYYKDQIFTISVRTGSGEPEKTIQRINSVLAKYDPEYAPDYVFLHDAFAAMYGGEYRLIQLIQAGSILAIILTILGLASITAITIRQRTKEIGIRKTIGASTYEIVQMLVSSQIRRLIVTVSLAGMIALWIVQTWLENYAYRVGVSFWMFLVPGAAILLIALVVTATISCRAALANPVDALRYE